MAGWFITGTDTGVGKTRVSAALIQALRSTGHSVIGMKPVASGCRVTPGGLCNEDAELLMQAASVNADYSLVNPYAFEPAIAPHIAAREAGVRIELTHISDAYTRLAGLADHVVVEGVGGWRVPLGRVITTEHLAKALGLPVVLVVGLRLGCLNHALLTAGAIEAAGLPLAGWVANEIEPDMDSIEENVAFLAQALTAPLLGHLSFDPGRPPDVAAQSLSVGPMLTKNPNPDASKCVAD